jgi:deoxyribodipyrimidine photo-lyase
MSTSTLFHPDDLPFSVRDIPEVFTEFRKRAERDAQVRNEFPVPSAIPTPDLKPTSIPTLQSLNVDTPQTDKRVVLAFRGGEHEALARATHYLMDSGCLSNYKETRNGLIVEVLTMACMGLYFATNDLLHDQRIRSTSRRE